MKTFLSSLTYFYHVFPKFLRLVCTASALGRHLNTHMDFLLTRISAARHGNNNEDGNELNYCLSFASPFLPFARSRNCYFANFGKQKHVNFLSICSKLFRDPNDGTFMIKFGNAHDPEFSQKFRDPINALGIPWFSLFDRSQKHLVHPETICPIYFHHIVRIDYVVFGL